MAGEAEAPTIAEATEGEAGALRTSEAEVAETEVSRTTEAEVAEVGASRTTEAEVAEVGASRTTEAEVVVTVLSVVAKDLPGVARELEARSLEKLMFLWQERDVWDQLRQQKDILAGANKLLSARSTEVEDLCLHCADIKAEVAMAREQAAPLAARIQELEEELTRAASERDTFRSWAAQEVASTKAVTEQLEAEKGAHLLTKGALSEAIKVAETSRSWSKRLPGQLRPLGSRFKAGRRKPRLWGALYTGVKRALAIVSSHYTDVDLEAISDSYVMAEDDEKAEEEVLKLVGAAEAPGTALARLFEEEVVPPTPTADVGDLGF
ncbi:protein MLP1 homolog [Miscanthus floridulus]|uniref:protein MLP1 homolog n=1 Tax=Miscanthus floridulus TaxID=154761 RepID=UPI00345A0982